MTHCFGTLPDGRKATLYFLKNPYMQVAITDLGAALVRWLVPGKDAKNVDIVLGYDSAEEYYSNPGMMGAIVGRNANRIRDAEFCLNGKTYTLAANSGQNNIHSGPDSYHLRLWDMIRHEDQQLQLHLYSPDGDQGFPGNAHIFVTYTLCKRALDITYAATSDRPTIFNLTNHAYFNLAGHKHPERAMHQILQIHADHYTPTRDDNVPAGILAPVDSTCLDFTSPKSLQQDITNQLLVPQKGYDHNFILRNDGPVAILEDPFSGRRLTVVTDRPGLQLYSANYLNVQGKDNIWYPPYSGICLETQFYPDSIHHPHWPQPTVPANTVQRTKTAYIYHPSETQT